MTLIAFFLWTLLAFQGIGRAALRAFGIAPEDRLERFCLAWATGYAVCAVAITLLGIPMLLTRGVLLGVLGLSCVVGAKGILELLADLRAGAGRVLLGLVVVAGLYVAVLVPATDWDVLHYHYTMPRLYADAHGFPSLPLVHQSCLRSYAQSVTVLAFSLEGEGLAAWILLTTSLLVPVTVFACARRHLGGRAAALSALVFAAMPAFSSMAIRPMADLPLALFGTAAFFSFAEWRRTGAMGRLLHCAVMAGFASGVKWSGLLLVPLFLALGAWAALRTHPRDLGKLAIAGAVASVIPLPLMALNVRDFGNPVYPGLYQWLGGTVYASRTGVSPGLPWWKSLSIPIAMSLSYASVGPLHLLLAPLGRWVRGTDLLARLALAWGGLCLAAIIGLMVATPGGGMQTQLYWDAARYLSFLLAPLAVWCGWAADRLLSEPGRHRLVLCGFVAASALASAALLASAAASRARIVLSNEPREAYLARNVVGYDCMMYANAHLGDDTLTFCMNTYCYHLRRPFVSELWWIGLIDYDALRDGDDLLRWMDSRHVTHMLVPPDRTAAGVNPSARFFREFVARHPDVLDGRNFVVEFRGRDGTTLYRRVRP